MAWEGYRLWLFGYRVCVAVHPMWWFGRMDEDYGREHWTRWCFGCFYVVTTKLRPEGSRP